MQATDNKKIHELPVPTSWQLKVLEALKGTETEKHPLSKWYLGALYAWSNPDNPDRVSQAANSLRELVEKLPRVVQEIDVQEMASSHEGSIFREMRSDMEKHIREYKQNHPGGWKGQKIDNNLAEALAILDNYLERNKQPNRAEKMKKAVTSIDPMVDRLGSQIQKAKWSGLHKLWKKLEGFTHHNSRPDREFRTCLEELERTVIDLLAPITAQDQGEIQAILSRPDRSENDIEQMFSLIERRGANFVFFFKHAAEAADATWLPFLNERGYFADAPWWPIHYLANIADQVPDEAIEIVQQLPETNNSMIYNEILEIALRLHGEYSVKLKLKILESTDINDQLLAYRYAYLLAHWVAENQTSAALELTRVLIEFAPDPQSEAKEQRSRENPTDPGTLWETSLKPSPQISLRTYREIMSKGVRPLAEKEPYQVARLLTNATANMIRLQMHQEDMDQEEDYSEAWCKRLHELDRNYENLKATLVHTLTFACEQVYEKSPDSVVALDKALRNQQWKVFKRLRQHLYTQYPNEQTKPWIRELILTHEEYHLWEHRYEFQQMIRGACEHFGESLLTEAERKQIFDAICSGPSKAHHQAWIVGWLGEEFSEEGFQQRQRDFNRKQFRPFTPLLFGEYATYFQELEIVANNPISDKDYPPLITRGGYVSNRSPYSPEDLANLADEELLTTINEWEGKEFFSEGDSFVEIDIEGLAGAFQTVFKEMIIPDANRLRFWLENCERIARPIYVRMMINGMQANVRAKNFDNLSEWLRFSEWVLSHPDQAHEDNYKGNESRENPNWYSSRRAVGDFIEVCLDEEVNVPVFARGQLTKLLEMLCAQFDSWLDVDKGVFSNRDNPIGEGIKNSRSRALETLVKFGFWLRRHDSESPASKVTTILEKRFAPEAKPPLMLPEYAILGKNYNQISSLDEAWTAEHKSDFFHRTSYLNGWRHLVVSYAITARSNLPLRFFGTTSILHCNI